MSGSTTWPNPDQQAIDEAERAAAKTRDLSRPGTTGGYADPGRRPTVREQTLQERALASSAQPTNGATRDPEDQPFREYIAPQVGEMDPHKPSMYKVDEVATMLNVSTAWVYDACRQDSLPHIRLGAGRGIRIPRESFQQWVNSHMRG